MGMDPKKEEPMSTTTSSHHVFGRQPRPDSERVLDLGRLLIGLVIVAVGGLYLLESAGVLDAGETIGDWWPSVIVLAGLLTLAERPPAVTRALILVAIGVVGLLFSTDVFDESAWAYVWPAAVVVAGLLVLTRWKGRLIPGTVADDEVLRSTAVFSGSKLASRAPDFRGAWLTAIFGGVELDLREAVPAPEGATVNATVAFGGAEIFVPRGWKVSVKSTPIFGGVEDKTHGSPMVPEDAPKLFVDAVCIFGGVEIKHEK